MQVLKTWVIILGGLALGFFALAWNQTRQTVRLRDAEIVRLKAHPAEPTSAPQAVPAASSQPALEVPAPAGEEPGDPNAAVQALVDMTAQRDRYKDGLQRCVDEANRLAQDTGRRFELPPIVLPAAAPSPAPKEPTAQPHISSLYSEPTVVPLGDRLQVTGKLYNTGTAEGTVTAAITLLHDGKPVTTAREKVSVPAQGQAAWSHTFAWSVGEGAWTAVVRVE